MNLEHKNDPNSLTNFIDTEIDKRPSAKLDEFWSSQWEYQSLTDPHYCV